WFLDDHLARLARSAGHFYFAWSESRIREELQEAARSFARGCMRVRLALAKDGTCQITVSSCELPEMLRLPETPMALANTLPVIDFSDQVMQKDCAWLQHKTTHREIYDEEFNKARERGLFDMVFLNGAGEVTEGCITNIILCHEGKYSTPLLGSGLLPGVMRGHLLADLERPLRETVLRAEDVRRAEAIYLCNSVRGLVQVALPNRF
ncbi:MAG: aminotransferase class IV, partial [Desulfoprunum sp.]|nr:aminotransferase class IV [Desulfoprunum sp.]